MIQYIKYTALAAILCCLFTSCLFDEKNLFDESSAQRLNAAIANTENVLKSAENGWIMEYFPNNATEGYTFLMKFRADGIAEVASRNKYTPQYTMEKGVWKVIGDNGPVLTFDSFIKNFHLFSDPRQPSNDYYDGAGLLGDYEFMILRTETDSITLSGKKRGTDIVMKRLPAGQNWEGYFDALENMDKLLFNSRLALDWNLNVEGKTYTLTGGATHIFTATPDEIPETDDDETEVNLTVPFIITDYGFRFYKAIERDGNRLRMFKLSDDKTYLYAVENDNKNTRITAKSIPPGLLFSDESNWKKGVAWLLNAESFEGAFAKAYTNVVNGCRTVYNQEFNYFLFIYKQRSGIESVTLSFRSGNRYEGIFDIAVSLKPGTNNEVIFVNKGTMDNNGKSFSDRIEGFREMLDLLSDGSFTVTTDSPLCPSVLKFTSVTNPSNRFSVTVY